MRVTVTMDSSGMLIIPRDIREQLHLRSGSRLNLEIKGDGVFLAPLPDEDARIVKRGGRLVIESAEPLSDDDVRKAIVSAREDRINHLSGLK
ncbi:AbrB/MazE/SpoVT family DNA-binding domain-containing protein [bacterium]|nr:AbrB/MazE/SpoVT family DNA-binding domain-containing protein [bacterium]